jgi:hypothetical protein
VIQRDAKWTLGSVYVLVGKQKMIASSPTVILLYFDGCPLTPPVRQNLAIAVATLRMSLEEVDLATLPPGDPLLHYGSPTVLVNGRDVLGLPPSPDAGLACRPYPEGLPTAERWAELLRAATAC